MHEAQVNVGISRAQEVLHILRAEAGDNGDAPDSNVFEIVHDATKNRRTSN